MCEKGFVFLCCGFLLLISSSSKSQQNFTNNEEKDAMEEKEVFENSSMDSNKNNVVPYEMCHNNTCILLCCPLGDRLADKECIPEKIDYVFPNVYGYTKDSLQRENEGVDQLVQLAVHDSCQEQNRSFLHAGWDDYIIFVNSSLYLPHYEIFAKPSSYCLAIVDKENEFQVTICSETSYEVEAQLQAYYRYKKSIIYMSTRIISALIVMPIFLVYTILPELRNVHGFMLRNYCLALAVGNVIGSVTYDVKADDVSYPACVVIAILQYFGFISCFFWLMTMSFDTWWTFRELCSVERNVKQRERRKLIYYSIFAWGSPFILSIVTIIMDFFPEYVPQILRPEFQLGDCFFASIETFELYFFGIRSVSTAGSVCLSILTALKIASYEKDAGHRLTSSESKRFNDNKKWFSLYLKLFIMQFILMGISWLMVTVFLNISSKIIYFYLFLISSLLDILQDLCTFIIFICKKKIKLLLLKRFRCGLFPICKL